MIHKVENDLILFDIYTFIAHLVLLEIQILQVKKRLYNTISLSFQCTCTQLLDNRTTV